MPDNTRNGDSQQGDADSSGSGGQGGGLWGAIKSLFDDDDGPSLREQLEEAIEEHEEEQASGEGDRDGGKGDLSRAELIMLKNLLHFSEHDADDIAVPRGQIVAIDAESTWDEVVALFAEHGHSRLPVYRETLDDVIGMMHIKDVFPLLAQRSAIRRRTGPR
jgi:magnesium and cobalt transporter